MRSAELKKYREALLRKKEDILSATKDHSPAVDPASRSGDWVDQSSLENDLHIRLSLKQTDSKLLRAIEEAIYRIDHGTYGICMDCEQEISPARLQAVPWTRVCIDCKEKQGV